MAGYLRRSANALAVMGHHRIAAGRSFLPFAVAALFAIGCAPSSKPNAAAPRHEWVTDSAQVLPNADRERLSALLSEFHRRTHHQIAVLTVATLGDQTIESFSLGTARERGLRYRGLDNGILVTLAIKERRVRFELGTGMERYISEADANSIIESEMTPAFSNGDFSGSLERGLKRLMDKARNFVVRTVDLPAGVESTADDR